MEEHIGNIQWFPGHMTKTRRKMKESLSLVDVVVEIVDARIPLSSRIPDLDELTAGKPRVIVLNKADIADDKATSLWVRTFQEQGMAAMSMDCRSGKGLGGFLPLVKRVLADRIQQWQDKGMAKRAIRMMIVGVPNSGKSTFINRMSGGGKARTEDRPGVTRGNQWYTAADGSQLLDTPGILWPKFENQTIARHLAFTGAIRDEVLSMEELACGLLSVLKRDYAGMLCERYKLSGELPEETYDLLQEIARKRGMLLSGGVADTERAASMLLDEFRAGKLGRITLERPEQGEMS